MEQRHELLWNTIGYLKMEQEALDRGRMIRNWSLIYMFVGTLLEAFFFFLYNGICHPFAKILKVDNYHVQGRVCSNAVKIKL